MRALLTALCVVALVLSCSHQNDPPVLGPDNSADTIPTATVSGQVISGDTLNQVWIENASITVFDATTNQPVTQTITDSLGQYSLLLDSGVYYLKVEAQDFYPSPRAYGAPIPFQVDDSQTVAWPTITLKPDTTVVDAGILTGMVTSGAVGAAGILVVAMDQADSTVYSVSSGANGAYSFFNLPAGTYTVRFYRAGYTAAAVDSLVATVTADNTSHAANFALAPFTGTRLTGHVTFRSAQNGIVDVTLVNPVTRMAIPGLYAFNNPSGGNVYTLTDIPPGTYVAWASYRNDGFVVDPDYVFKFGLPVVTFSDGDTAKQDDFSVTSAIAIMSPTNPADSVFPVAISTSDTAPTFVWKKYPSTKEYVIAVYTTDGDRIWGGYNSTGAILHPQIPSSDTSAVFNFDGSATSRLIPGQVYQWKVYADNSADPGIQTLISSSEDLRGLFYIPDEAN